MRWRNENLCNYIHLPVQSGNSDVLKRMNRRVTLANVYLQRIEAIHKIIPDCYFNRCLFPDFCGETEAEHKDTLSLMDAVNMTSHICLNIRRGQRPWLKENLKMIF